MEAGLRFRPPNAFTDSREFSDAECDRDILDLEVQKTLEVEHSDQDKLASLLIR